MLPAATEIAAALGLMESVVGVSHECDFPEEAFNASAYFARPGPRVVDSLEILAGILHRKEFPEVLPANYANAVTKHEHARPGFPTKIVLQGNR